jgi:predicted TIM-barrel fold metal-dependent hydrolase
VPDDPTPVSAFFGRHPVIDAHVHVFPPPVFAALWRWFDEHAWSIRYRLTVPEIAAFLRERGVARGVGLQYAHKPGMARELNVFAQVLSRMEPWFIPCATVFPGEDDARAILDAALGPQGLRGVKIHCHVQCVGPDDRRLDDVYDAAAAHDVPVVIHAGDAPALPAYTCDVGKLCRPSALEHALRRHPRTTFVVPHLFAANLGAARRFLDEFEHLYLDTTMALAGFIPLDPTTRQTIQPQATEWQLAGIELVRAYPERILYGSDFPNLPYEWDHELRLLRDLALPDAALGAILGGNAGRLFRL